MSKLNPIDILKEIPNIKEILVAIKVMHSSEFTVHREMEIHPADFHFDKQGIITFDALLKNYGLECDLKLDKHGKAIFTIEVIEYHREDGGIDYLYFPSQDEEQE